MGDAFSGGAESGALWSPCSRAGQAPSVPGHQIESDPGRLLGRTVGGELEGELGQYGAFLLKAMLEVEGAKLKFQLRLVSCPNSFSSCDVKHRRPISEGDRICRPWTRNARAGDEERGERRGPGFRLI